MHESSIDGSIGADFLKWLREIWVAERVAAGHEECGVWGGGVPFPIGDGVWGGALPIIFFEIFG